MIETLEEGDKLENGKCHSENEEELRKRRERKRREATRPKVKPDNTFLLCDEKGSENVVILLFHSIEEDEEEVKVFWVCESVCNFVGVFNYKRFFSLLLLYFD